MATRIIAAALTIATLIFLLGAPVLFTVFDRAQYEVLYTNEFVLGNGQQQSLTYAVLEYIGGTEVYLIPFTAAEQAHLFDVRTIFFWLENAVIGCTILLLLLIPYTWWYKHQEQLVLRALWRGSLVSIGVLTLIAIAAALDFTKLFDVFHRIFFPQGNWQFAAHSVLIQLFPEWFFAHVAEKIVTRSAIISVSLFVALSAVLYSRKT